MKLNIYNNYIKGKIITIKMNWRCISSIDNLKKAETELHALTLHNINKIIFS